MIFDCVADLRPAWPERDRDASYAMGWQAGFAGVEMRLDSLSSRSHWSGSRASALASDPSAVARASLALAALLAGLTTGACSSNNPRAAFNPCGTVPQAVVSGRKPLALGSCAGQLNLTPLPRLTVKVGEKIRLLNLSSARGYSDPSSSVGSVVVVQAVVGTTAELKAVAAGTATIAIKTTYCLRARSGPCPALELSVVA